MYGNNEQSLAKRLNDIALTVSIVITLALSANHLFTAYGYESQRIQAGTRSIAASISRLAYEKPDIWQFQEERIRELAKQSQSSDTVADPARYIEIRDGSGAVIVHIGAVLGPPAISGSSPIMDGPVVVGAVVLSEDVTRIWTRAVVPLMLGILLGIAVFLILRYLPIRALLTRERQLQETTLQLRQAQKMEAIGQLTGGIAHDFNNLLCVVIGNLELIQETLDRKSPGYQFAQSAIDAAQRGATLTQQLLSFARKQMLRPRIIELNALVTGITGMLHRTLGETIRIEMDLAENLWPAKIDPAQMELAILNLATNARHAMPEGGVITIKTSNCTLEKSVTPQQDTVAQGPYVAMTFSDNGVGIPADILPRIFEPFFTTREVGQGSGLGLSMVHGFIRQSHGHIAIDSREGGGTVITFYFPALFGTNDDLVASGIPVNVRGRARETVLVVEDDPELLAMSASRISALGYTVLQAADGRTALEILAENPTADLLFTDIVLPNGMSGTELASAAQQCVPDIRVAFTTGYNEKITGPDGVLDDRFAVLAKPYRQQELAQFLRRALVGRTERV